MDGILAPSIGLTVNDAGTGVVVFDQTCAGRCCVGPCARLRKYIRCPVPPTEDCPTPAPDHLWVCDDMRCPVQNGGPPQVIWWRGIGYRRTEEVVNYADAPPLDQVWNAVDAGITDADGQWIMNPCFGSCDDPGLSNPRPCPLWEEAFPCEGQTVPPGGFARVFVQVRSRAGDPSAVYFNAGDCGIVQSPLPLRPGCYEFRVGTAPWRGTLPTDGYQGVFTLLNGQCCECVSGCSLTIASVQDCLRPIMRDLRCCCSCSGLFSLSFEGSWDRTIGGVRDVFGVTGNARTEYGKDCEIVTSDGTRLDTYDVTGPGIPPHHEENTQPLNAGEVCAGPIVTGGGYLPFPPFPSFAPWPVRNPETGGLDQVDASYKCPAQLGGRRSYTLTRSDGSSVEMRITHPGLILRCDLVAFSWQGDAIERDADGVITSIIRTSWRWTAARLSQVRCTGRYGCGGSTGSGVTPGSPIMFARPSVSTFQPVTDGAMPDGSAAALLFLRAQ